MSSLVGRALGPYQVEKKIGEGGNSDVYLARDTVHNRPVALKVLRLEHQGDRKKVERFWRGGQSARALEHPHIVPVYDAGLADSRYYIAMAHMEGRSIEDLQLELGGPLPWATALHYLEQIAGAIDYAHQRGVIHRDIKPSNILLSADRKSAYLTDFGIALLTGRETLTEHGTLVGTPEYISPEQIKGETADARSDIYSLGITAYHMLSGKLPFDGPPAAVLYNHINTPPPSIRRANRDVPEGFTRPVSRALAKQPSKRYPTAAAFVHDLKRAAGGRRRPVWPLWVGLAAALLVVAWLIIGSLDGGGTTTPTAEATLPGPTLNPTDIGTEAPTSTIAPTPRLTSTVRPPPTASGTSVPGATRTPSPNPSRTAAPVSDVGVSPLLPVDGAVISRGAAIQTFRWAAEEPLAEDQSYELRFFPAGSEEYLQPTFGWWRENSAEIDLNNMPVGTYDWVVAVVRGRDGNWEEDIAISEPFRLEWGQ